MDTDGSDSLITELQQAARGREECVEPEHGDGGQGSVSCCEHIPVEASVSMGPVGRDSVVGPDTLSFWLNLPSAVGEQSTAGRRVGLWISIQGRETAGLHHLGKPSSLRAHVREYGPPPCCLHHLKLHAPPSSRTTDGETEAPGG